MSGLERVRNLVGGALVAPGELFESFDPCCGKPWALIPRDGAAAVDAAAAAAHATFRHGPWPQVTASARGRLPRKLADLIERDVERLAAHETRDSGKLLAEMRTQLASTPAWYRHFGGLADKIEGGRFCR